MSDLDELKRRIYAKTPNIDNRPQGTLSFQKIPASDIGWQQKPLPSFFIRHLWFFLIGFLILFGGTIFLLTKGSFSEDNVVVNVTADGEVNSIQPVRWQVVATNKNSTNLQDVTLTFEYPEHANPIDDQVSGRRSVRTIGLLEAKKSVQRSFSARLFGQEDETLKVRVLITYKTPGISRVFEKELTSQVRISTSPLQLSFRGPDTLRADTVATWQAVIENNSDTDLTNIRLRLEYPEQFSFVDSKPSPELNNSTWVIPSLKIGQEKTVEIRGRLSGSIGDQRTLTAFLEVGIQQNTYVLLTKKVAASKITIEPLSIGVIANGQSDLVVHTGQPITYEISYKNNATQAINDVAIEGQLVGDAIDITSIQTQGRFDPLALKVRWDFNNTPELKEVLPNQEGKVSFVVNVKNKLPIKAPTDKNFQIRLVATIATDNPSTSLPASVVKNQKEFVARVGTELHVNVDGDYRIGSGPFSNTGGIPPTAQRQTTYTVYWRIMNTSNDVHELSLVATLPEHSAFTGLKQANFEGDSLYYDAAKRQMVWTIKNVRATTGVALPTYEAVFQIGVTPSTQDVGSIIDIFGSTQVKAVDSFTNEVINPSLIPPLKTDLGGKLRKGEATVAN